MIIHAFDFAEDGICTTVTAKHDPDGTITILDIQDNRGLTIDGEYEDITNKRALPGENDK
jgi:hypothetical protein